MATNNHVAEAVRQMAQGEDFWSADDLTRDLSPEQAVLVPHGCPYSIATEVGHMLFWQDRWVAYIQGRPVSDGYTEAEDFPQPTAENWVEMRARLVAGMELAAALASSEDPERPVNGRTVGKLLLQIAIHNSYHIGQIAILRQVAGFGMPQLNTESPAAV